MLDGRYIEQRRTLLAVVVEAPGRPPRRGARAQRRRGQSRLARQHDRVRHRDRRPLRLRDARRRHHRRHADRLHRLRAVGRRPDPRAAARVVPAGPGGAARAHASPDRRSPTTARSRSPSCTAATPACTATARVTSRWRRATASRCGGPHSARASSIPEGHDYFATLREKLHWSATPERIVRLGRVRCCARLRSATSSSSQRSTSSSPRA